MRIANLFALVVVAAWSALLWLGVHLMKGVVAQQAHGYPTPDQFDYLIGVPLAIIATVAATVFLANCAGRLWIVSCVVSAVALIAALPYLLMLGGGV